MGRRTTDGDRVSSLVIFAKIHRIISGVGSAKIPATRLAYIILRQVNDFNRSLKSSQAPGPLVNFSSAESRT